MTFENPAIAAQEQYDASVDEYCSKITYSVEKEFHCRYTRKIAEDGFDCEGDAIDAAKRLCIKNKKDSDIFHVTLDHPDENPEYLHSFCWCDALGKAVDECDWVEEVAE